MGATEVTKLLTTARIVERPEVFLFGRQSLVDAEVSRYLRHIDAEGWHTDAPCAGQALIETGARVCYRSFKSGRPHEEHIENLLESGHGSCLEHCVFTLMITGVSRSLTHELVRHRVGLSYSQESQRYVDARSALVVPPPDMASDVLDYLIRRQAGSEQNMETLDAEQWVLSVERSLEAYSFLASHQDRPTMTTGIKTVRQRARSVLPNCVETRIQITGNARAWRHFLVLRGSPQADPEIRRLAKSVYEVLQVEAPDVFGDFEIGPCDVGAGGGWELASHYGSV
jgi:thymidylate synthase (FAD)